MIKFWEIVRKIELTNPRNKIFPFHEITCFTSRVGSQSGESKQVCSCVRRFLLKPENSNSCGFELHTCRLSIKGTLLLLKVIKAIIIITETGQFSNPRVIPNVSWRNLIPPNIVNRANWERTAKRHVMCRIHAVKYPCRMHIWIGDFKRPGSKLIAASSVNLECVSGKILSNQIPWIWPSKTVQEPRSLELCNELDILKSFFLFLPLQASRLELEPERDSGSLWHERKKEKKKRRSGGTRTVAVTHPMIHAHAQFVGDSLTHRQVVQGTAVFGFSVFSFLAKTVAKVIFVTVATDSNSHPRLYMN